MRKRSKGLISMILSAAMVITLGAGTFTVGNKASAADDEPVAGIDIGTTFKAYLAQSNSRVFDYAGDDSKGYDDDGKLVIDGGFVASCSAISTTGRYSISASAYAVDDLFKDASYIGVEFGELGKTTNAEGKTIYKQPETFSILPKWVKIHRIDPDLEDVTLDWSKIGMMNNGNVETGKLRLSVINNYLDPSKKSQVAEYEKANPFMDNVNGTWTAVEDVFVDSGDTIEFIFDVTADAPTPPPATPTPVATPTPTAPPAAKSYDAYLGFQTDNWVFRNMWHDKLGLDNKEGIKYNEQVTISGQENGKEVYKAHKATIKNAEMTANGTYTVSISDVDISAIADDAGKKSTMFNMLFVSTKIPQTMTGVTAEDTILKIDGVEVAKGFAMPPKPDEDEYYQFMVADSYIDNDGIVGVKYSKDDEKAKTTALKVIPKKSIEITFTLKGANFAGDYTAKTLGTEKNKTFTSGNFKYKVTTAATIVDATKKKTQGKVTLVGLTSKGKKAKKLNVKNTVSVKSTGATYKVTKLGAGAFKNAKAKSVTLGSAIKSIPKTAFKGCKQLSALKLNAKVSVAKGAFKGCKKKIKVSGKSKKANLKKLKKSGYKKFK